MEVSTKYINQRIIVDCSVLAKIYLDEGDSALIRELIEMHKRQQLALIASPLIVFELFNALANTIMDPDIVDKCFKRFKGLQLVTLDLRDGYIREAYIKTCKNKAISYYDASYHALAKDMDGIFLTADKKYYDATKDEGNIVLYESPA